MTTIDPEGQALWISEHLDLPLGVVESVLALEFEFMVGMPSSIISGGHHCKNDNGSGLMGAEA